MVVKTRKPGTARPREMEPSGLSYYKELDCLYRIQKKIASSLHTDALDPDGIFLVMVNELRDALRYPDLASARIVIEGKEFRTGDYKESELRESAAIAMYGEKFGLVEVNYAPKVQELDTEPFTTSERLLIDFVAGWVWRINENRLVENNLRQSTMRLQTLLENLPDNIYEVDKDMTILWTNRSPQDVGRRCYDIYFSGSQSCEDCPLIKCLSMGQKQVGTMKHEAGGKMISYEIIGVPIKAKEGDVLGAIAVARNVTERMRTEEKLQAASHLALIGQLASGIAHEINNPLTGVMAFSDLLMRQGVHEDAREAVETIHEGAQRVSDIVRRLLKFARPQSRDRKPVDLNKAIESTLTLQRYSLIADNITVTTEFDPELPLTLADEAQMQEVFHNLIANARAAMKTAHNGGKLAIRTWAADNNVCVSFKDDGPGILDIHKSKLFTPFFTTRPVGEGTGLGLSICHGIVTEHGGHIYADSEPGNGAIFTVEIPMVTEREGESKEVRVPVSDSNKPPQLRILVVDDELIVRRSLGNILSAYGHNVETIGIADEALHKLKTQDYDIILLDVKLPTLSGVELYRLLEQTRPSLLKRIIFITGDVIGEDTLNFFSAEKVHYLLKPLNIDDLEKTIRTVASARQRRRRAARSSDASATARPA